MCKHSDKLTYCWANNIKFLGVGVYNHVTCIIFARFFFIFDSCTQRCRWIRCRYCDKGTRDGHSFLVFSWGFFFFGMGGYLEEMGRKFSWETERKKKRICIRGLIKKQCHICHKTMKTRRRAAKVAAWNICII